MRENAHAAGETERGAEAPRIEIVTLPDPVVEADFVAWTAREETRDRGVSPDRIEIVAVRDVMGDRLLRGALDRYGVPFYGLDREPLLFNPAVGTLLSLFDTAADGFRRRALEALLMSGYLARGIHGEAAPVDPVLPDLIERGAILRGLDAWISSFERLAAEAADPSLTERLGEGYDPIREGRRLRAARSDPDRLGRLCGATLRFVRLLGEIPERAPIGAYGELIFSLAERLRIAEGVHDVGDTVTAARDRRALEALRAALRTRWAPGEVAGSPPDASLPLPLAEFTERLRAILRESTYRIRTDPEEGIRVVRPDELQDARPGETGSPNADVVLVCVLNEDTFPGPDSSGRAGKAAPPGLSSLLARTLRLTRPRLDLQGRQTVPSGCIDRLAGHPGVRRRWVGSVSPPGGAASCDAVECRGGGDGHRGHGGPADRKRDRGGQPARLCSADLLEMLRARFGAERALTPSLLSAWIHCPFRFLVEQVWKLEGREARSIGMAPSIRGRIAHRILDLFYADLVAEGAFDPEAVEPGLARLDAIARRVLEGWFRLEGIGPSAFFVVEGDRLRHDLAGFVRRDFALSARIGARPVLTEHTIHGGEAPPRVETPAGEVKIGGRIDRVDRLAGPGEGHVVIDYKSRTIPSRREIRQGRSPQIPLYILGLEALGVRVLAGEYRSIAEGRPTASMGPEAERLGRTRGAGPGREGRLGRASGEPAGGRAPGGAASDWETIRSAVVARIGEAIAGVRRGEFPPAPADCPAGCGLRDLCRVDPARVRAQRLTL